MRAALNASTGMHGDISQFAQIGECARQQATIGGGDKLVGRIDHGDEQQG